MSAVNKETLLDYLFSEIGDDKIRCRIDEELKRSPSHRSDLADIQKILGKVSLLNEEVEPPADLIQKTLACVSAARGSAIPLTSDDAPAVPDEVIIFPLIRSEERTKEKRHPLPPHRLSRRPAAFVRHNAVSNSGSNSGSPTASSPIAEQNIRNTHRRRNYIELSAAVAAGIMIALFVFPLIYFAGNQIQTYVTQSKMQKINKNLNTYTQLAETQILQKQTEEAAPQTESARADLTTANWQEVIPAKVPLLNVGSGSQISVLPSDNEPNTLQPNNSPSFVYLVSSPVFQDTGTAILPNSTLTAQNPPDILYHGQMPEKVEQVELNHRDLDYQTLMAKINGTVLLMNGQQSHNPTVQTAAGQNVLLQNGKVFFRELPVFLPQGR